MSEFSLQENQVLDEIVRSRRSVRQFSEQVPTTEFINKIVEAGLYAPYAALAVGRYEKYRHFFVMLKGNDYLPKINNILKENSAVIMQARKEEAAKNPDFMSTAAPYMHVLESISQNGLPGFLDAPSLIIIAERKGTPKAELQSLAHTLQNMWLKATALGLGVHILSAIEGLSDNESFSSLLGLTHGEYAFTGCIIGYPKTEPTKSAERDLQRDVTWL